MGPLKPIIDRSPENRDSPKSPHELFEQLSRAAREGFAEIDEFKSAWNGPETQAIWNRVEERMNERGGEYPPISTVWDENYDMVLQQLDRAEQQQKIAKKRAEEESEMNRQATTEGGWQGILESFKARGLPGISAQVLPPSHDGSARFSIQLHSISTILYLQSIRDPALRDMESWHISLDNRQTPSMLAQEIVACLSDRDRKWDLPYLLVSYLTLTFNASLITTVSWYSDNKQLLGYDLLLLRHKKVTMRKMQQTNRHNRSATNHSKTETTGYH